MIRTQRKLEPRHQAESFLDIGFGRPDESAKLFCTFVDCASACEYGTPTLPRLLQYEFWLGLGSYEKARDRRAFNEESIVKHPLNFQQCADG